MEKSPFLLEYLSMVPIEKVGFPEYHSSLSRSLSDRQNPNVLYPVSRDFFAHIYSDPESDWNYYISIEPILTRDIGPLMEKVERKLLDHVHKANVMASDQEKKEFLLRSIDFICDTNGRPHGRGLLPIRRGPNGKLRVSPNDLRAIKYVTVRDKIGLGALEPMIRDPWIEDISCSGVGSIYIEHKLFRSLKSSTVFLTYDELDEFVLTLSEKVKRPVSFQSPIADSTLPDGSRINIVYGRHLARRGSNFSIRKFSEVPLSVMELTQFGTLDYKMGAYLSMVIGQGMNVFVSGETASGKTTTLNAITTFVQPNAKIVSIEETPELRVPHKNWIQEVVELRKEEGGPGVSMFDLVKAALRQRPNFIIVGEIRGREGSNAFQAMQTGHSVMSTFHASSVEKLIQRLTGDPIYVPKAYIDNLNVVIIQALVKLPNGKPARRVLSINELVGYDSQSGSFTFIEAFRWDPVTDTFKFTGDLSSYLLEEKIAVRLGIPLQQKKRIYAELDRRATILERLHKEKGVTGFYELLEVLAKAQRKGLF
jgi:flagellar protein FlaI